jgi:glycosyltransferase involved in cell wall biosynthesis
MKSKSGKMPNYFRTYQVCLEYTPEFGGSAVAAKAYANAMNSSVIAFTSAKQGQYSEGWNENVLRIPVRSDFPGRQYALPSSKGQLEALRNVLEKSDLAVIHLLYRFHIQWAANLLYRAKIPYWVVPHGSLDPWVFTYRALSKRMWLKIIGSRIFRRAEAIIFATERERQKALHYLRGCKTAVIHLPVEYPEVSRINQIRNAVRAFHGIPRDDRLLIWVGRLHSMKRPLETIAAFGKMQNPKLHLMMIGPDDTLSLEDCKRYCSTHRINNVHLMGPIYGNKKFDYFASADAYISLSHRENFNYTAAEALAFGLPVILSKGNDLALELENQNCGWMLETDLPEEAEDAIRRFISTPKSVLCNMGSSGRKWARDFLSTEAFEKAVWKLVRETVGR